MHVCVVHVRVCMRVSLYLVRLRACLPSSVLPRGIRFGLHSGGSLDLGELKKTLRSLMDSASSLAAKVKELQKLNSKRKVTAVRQQIALMEARAQKEKNAREAKLAGEKAAEAKAKAEADAKRIAKEAREAAAVAREEEKVQAKLAFEAKVAARREAVLGKGT